MGIYIPNINANQFDKLCEEKGLKFIYIFIPTPHGRLIDADELLEIGNKTGLWCNDRWHIRASAIHDAPTVIEAEE